ncbi:oxysterol-binding protein-related protein 4C isoform X1 [Cinnamomum micranthum f. kanehirae]|uniref:Oxysterol-binding protein-related protein 4C isoform X1 n=1 Tax=Cinnamomum micranthum f. kanehirae TaxID=337451 RepID=A0A3S4Q2C8_9MAGN|nr:oxysterol-binding protein-related protein 4C isoform X1 [Cinnamomum micranthum f. kanehirae]
MDSGVVIAPPLSLEGGLAGEHKTPNILQCVLSLFKNVQCGSDLTRFELPPLFNMPKSQLQCYGESVYCIGEDILSKCSNGKTNLERFVNVVAWSISHNRPVNFGATPFNPVLGETHHVSRGTLNVLLEQVSHHPPVSALHATDEKANVELVWCQSAIAKFHGASVEAVIHGKRQLKLLKFESSVRITGLEADLCYKGNSFLGLGSSPRFVKGRIFYSSSMETIYDIEGHWDRMSKVGKRWFIYNGKEAISKLETPVLKDPKVVLPTESAFVWGEVKPRYVEQNWEKAKAAKKSIEREGEEVS